MILYIRMDGNQKLALLGVAVSIVVDAVLGAVLVGTCGMGLFGIGVALVASNTAGFLVTAAHFLKKDSMLRIRCPKIDRGELSDIAKRGMPTAINRGAQTLKNIILNGLLMAIAGSAAVAALSIQTTVYQVLIGICSGYGVMASMMCSMFIGEKDRTAVRDSVRACLRSGVVVCTAVTVIVIAIAPLLVSAFLRNGGDFEMSVRCLRLFMLSFPLSVVNLVLLYYYQS